MIKVVTRDARIIDLKQIWTLCFPGDEKYKQFFFNRIYCRNNLIAAKNNDMLVGMLHMLPQTFVSKSGERLSARYLYAIGIHPDYRGIGVGKMLVERALELMWRRDDAVATLVPGDDKLFNYYGQLDFEPCFVGCGYSDAQLSLNNGKTAIYRDIPHLQAIYDNSMRGKVHVLRDEGWWRLLLDECRVTGGQVLFEGCSYIVLGPKNKVREYCKNGVYPPFTSRGIQPYGMTRIVDVGKVRRWADCKKRHISEQKESLTLQVFGDAYMNLMWD